MGARILVVDDEPAIVRAVETNLRRHDFTVEVAGSVEAALSAYRAARPDLVLLDLGLPGADGKDLIRALRETASTPIIVLSAREGERDKVEALDLGADDYLTKPFSVNELLARIRVALRHTAKPTSGAAAIFRTGTLEVDFERRVVRLGGDEVHLTPTEYELLHAFIEFPNKLLTDRMLLQRVWGPDYGSEGHYLHVYVARLRKKLERQPAQGRLFVTEPGVGYRFVTAEDDAAGR
ncbi:MAG TPA: response regulator transcription factor [Candidatus Limnocylindria bacterium]